ncbi:MAG TPA: caspase family protein, partial [Kaistiaceae bacterium]|nr:caspase family protein [Kaistiaceae bacterium]
MSGITAKPARALLTLVLGALLVLAGIGGALAEKRVALVIGNGAYQATRPLPNPANDARAIAETLKRIGFDTVEVRLDQSFTDLRGTLRDFSRVARDSDVALVFYAGHGMEIGGVNYIVPVDARLQSDQDVPYEALPLDWVLAAIEPARRLRLVVLDACRDNPLASQMAMTSGSTRSLGRGLARVEPAGDTLVAYAAKAGSVAEDGDAANSPFTTALIANLPTPGLDVRLMFGRVRDAVLQSTGRRQEPFVYGSLGGGELSLVPGEATAPPAGAATTPAPDGAAHDLAFWQSIEKSENVALFRSYLKEFPNGRFRAIAEARVAELDKVAAVEPQRPAEAPPKAPAAAPAVTHAPPPSVPGMVCDRVGGGIVAAVCATTVLKAQSGNSYGPANIFDGSNRTAWVEGVDGNGEGEWLRFDFSGEATVGRVVVSNGYAKSDDIYKKNSRIRDVALEFSGGERFDFTLADQTGPQA